MQQANQCYYDNQWEQAISLLNQAASLCPESTEYGELLEQCQQAKEVEAYRLEVAAKDAEKFGQSLAEVLRGKSSAGNLVGTTVKWLKVAGHVFDKPEYQAFVDAACLLTSGEQKKMKSKLSNLAEQIGKDTIDKIINDLALV